MNKNDAMGIINRIIEDNNPFLPGKRCTTRVLVHFLENTIEDDLLPEGETCLYFELFTKEQIENSINKVNSAHLGCYFISILSKNNRLVNQINELYEKDKYLWATMCDTNLIGFNYAVSLPGRTSLSYELPYKYRNEEKLTSDFNASLYWSDSCSEAENSLKNSFISSKNNGFTCGGTGVGNSNKDKGNNSGDEDSNGCSKKIFSNKTKMTIKIFKVGAANTTYIKYENGNSILLDCGVDFLNPQNYTDSYNYIISELHPTVIVISHWHPDHYNLIEQIDSSELQQVIYLDYGIIPDHIRRLFVQWETAGIQINGFTDYIPEKYLHAWCPDIYLYVGEGNIPDSALQTTNYVGINTNGNSQIDINDKGIIVVVCCKNRIVILPADVAYYSWPERVKNALADCDKLVVPHHSCQVYGLNNAPQYRNTNLVIYISNYNKQFNDWAGNKHRSLIDFILNDTSRSKHHYTYDITSTSKPYYIIRI